MASPELIALVVEDHDFQRRTVARMLRSLGVQSVLEAADGRQALSAIRTQSSLGAVNLIVCDLDMPDMDGLELLRHLGLAQSTASVIIGSAKERSLLASVEKMASAYGVRLLGVIEKPLTLDNLTALIARHAQAQVVPEAVQAQNIDLDDILRGLRAHEFEPFFQPKASLITGQVVGAEALARWRHPQRGVVCPSDFIAALENSGQIDALTFTMLERAAQACRQWQAEGHDWTVSVNLSLGSLADTELADRITRTVRGTGLEPRHMIIEITETMAMTRVAPALENLARLRMRGFGLSIDDYGTGFASMEQLTRVAFTELKIDRGFVTDCAAFASSRTIVESSVEMARRLCLDSVAEGVETQAEWDFLKAAGCDVAQGYFFARPMDEAAFRAYRGALPAP